MTISTFGQRSLWLVYEKIPLSSFLTEEIVHISNENVDGMSHAEYYKGLYQECKRQLTAAVKAADTKYTGIVQKYRDLELM